jgi:hypothetical protein
VCRDFIFAVVKLVIAMMGTLLHGRATCVVKRGCENYRRKLIRILVVAYLLARLFVIYSLSRGAGLLIYLLSNSTHKRMSLIKQ